MELWPTLLNTRKNFLLPSYLKEDGHPLGWVCCRAWTGWVFGVGVLERTQEMYGSLGQVTLVGPFDLTCCKVIFFDCLFFLDSYSISSFCYGKSWGFNNAPGLIKSRPKTMSERRQSWWPKVGPPSPNSVHLWCEGHMLTQHFSF